MILGQTRLLAGNPLFLIEMDLVRSYSPWSTNSLLPSSGGHCRISMYTEGFRA